MRRMATGIVIVTGMLLTAAPVFAGGWAVTTMVDMPDTFVPGSLHEVVFEIRQHGTHLVSDLDGVAVVLTRAGDASDVRVFPATATGMQWRAVVETPGAGSWTWAIEPGWFGTYHLGPLPMGVPTGTSPPPAPRVAAGSVAILCGAAILLFQGRTRRMPA
jgi:hypothetical protein